MRAVALILAFALVTLLGAPAHADKRPPSPKKIANDTDDRDEDVAQRAKYLIEDLDGTLTKLTGRESPESPADWPALAEEWKTAAAGG